MAEDRTPEQLEALAARLMRRQARLSLWAGAVFVALLTAIPLLNLYAPKAMAVQIGGFTFSWMLLGILVFPFVWLMSGLFVKASDRIEDELAEEDRP